MPQTSGRRTGVALAASTAAERTQSKHKAVNAPPSLVLFPVSRVHTRLETQSTVKMGKKGKGTGSFVSSHFFFGGRRAEGRWACVLLFCCSAALLPPVPPPPRPACLQLSPNLKQHPHHAPTACRVSAATRRTLCAVVAGAALTTSRRAPARRAATRLRASALVSGHAALEGAGVCRGVACVAVEGRGGAIDHSCSRWSLSRPAFACSRSARWKGDLA